MRKIECSTQAEVDDAASAGYIAVVRAGEFSVAGSAVVCARDSATVYACDSATVYARDSATVDAYDSATVYACDSATVYARDSATVRDGRTKMALARTLPRLVIGPMGSRMARLGVSLPALLADQPIVYAGCWHGTLAAFEERVASVYPTGRYGGEYRAAIAFIRAMAAINEER